VLTYGLAERLVGISRDELKQADVAEEFAAHPQLRLFLGDVRDQARMEEALHGCDTVVHAAALKRVDAVAYNPGEVLLTNVLGTQRVIRAATAAGVARVLLVSSDKAVAPANMYGASKLMAEYVAVSMNATSYPRGTAISVLRYGNVLGSRGSVVHTWRRQAATGGPLAMTDARMTRFVLTLGQAVGFALRALALMDGGEIFVPVLPSARLTDLAEAVAPGVATTAVGLRPGGEKLAEALLAGDEPARTRRRDEFYVVIPPVCSWRADGLWPGVPVDPGLVYVSDGSHGWIGTAALQVLLREVPV
jgi:UDP-N-acetylglucosamine 4,6-dehydratase